MPISRPPGTSDDLDAVQVLDGLLRRAIAIRASDIHIEPKREVVRIRYRIDGVMVTHAQLPVALAAPITSRVKVLAKMDMTERRLPQDGHFSVEMGGHSIHLRASTFPGINGESLVMRVMLGHQIIPLEQLGMSRRDLERARSLCLCSSGLVIVCGPTGSGKTSTLYSLLAVMNTAERSVVTLEDPIEVEMPDIVQGQTNVKQGFTFAAGLRAILRQDPDVILVGEMRDPETAQIAMQASLTGHLVLSTLHTADAVETVTRLVDLGVEPWIVANALIAVVAQRLVRVLHPDCNEGYALEEDLRAEDRLLLERGTPLRRARGCPQCYGTGYKGRAGIFEVLQLDDDLRELIKSRSDKRSYRDRVRAAGLVPLREAGIARARAGLTSLEEVLRVT